MRIQEVHIKSQFKNLNDFKIDFDDCMENVLIGENATGKSNLMEALVVIFRDLDLEVTPNQQKPKESFEYYIRYTCRDKLIEVDYSISDGYIFHIDQTKLKNKGLFFKNKKEYLPKHIFFYYSGVSKRVEDLYSIHEKRYYQSIIKNESSISYNEIRPIFLVKNIHSSFALISLYLEHDPETLDFLKEELKINGFESALFILKSPSWTRQGNNASNLWGAEGLVRQTIENLLRYSIAPIINTERVHTNYKKVETKEQLYLFIDSQQTFQYLFDIRYDSDKIKLFNALESILLSDLLDDLKIKINKEKEIIESPLSMNELSEGEKQLLTVLGLLKFTRDEESLILLDEPDTHLNPKWKRYYLNYLRRVVNIHENNQIIFCTHDALTISGFTRDQVRLFEYYQESTNKKKVRSLKPEVDPKGLGVAGILREIFGMETTLDIETQNLLDKRNELIFKEEDEGLVPEEEVQLKELFNTLNNLGFSYTFKDPLYTEFIKQTEETLRQKKKELNID
jgi:energy-coupling factor transporter ATP-binding protein EcfA2